MRTRQRLARLSGIITLTAIAVALLLPSQPAAAITGSDFQPGRIIDNGVFFDPTGLTVSDIQAFLNAKVPNCDTNGTQPYAGTTRAAYAAGKGYPAPFICLKDYRADTVAKPAEAGLCNGYPAVNQTAAEIIYGVSQSCGVSTRALIVLLQKEQGLVTDDWPWSSQYQKATGFGCPDTAPCNSQYVGFFNQVYLATRQFKRYSLNPTNYNYVAGRDNYIQYNPNASCGGSNVYIQNQATAGLYNYTPYQPISGALSGLTDSNPGSTVTCGAYGNRNFWWYYNRWFGSTFAPNYGAQFIDQSAYPSMLNSYQRATVYMRFKNVGLLPWYDETTAWPAGKHPVRLGTDYPANRSSIFADGWRFGPSRPVDTFTAVYEADGTTLASNQHVVQPGQIAKFGFSVRSDPKIPVGTYTEAFRPLVEGLGAMNSTVNYFLKVTISPANYSATPVAQSPYPTIIQGNGATGSLSYKNSGNVAWYDEASAWSNRQLPVRLATDSSLGRQSALGSSWRFGPSRAADVFAAVYEANGTTLASDQHVVQPGQIAKFDFDLTTKLNTPAGFYAEGFRPIVEGWGPMNPTGTWLGVTVQKRSYTAQPAGQSAYPVVSKGSQAPGYFMYKNTGNVAWYDEITAWSNNQPPVRLSTDSPANRNSVFGSSWRFGPSRPVDTFTAVYEADGTTLASNQHVVQPGQIAKFGFNFKAASNQATGFYAEGFRPIVEGWGAMNPVGTWLGVTVTN